MAILPTKTWAFAPRDPNLSDTTNQFLSWVQQGLSFVLGQGTPLPAPTGLTAQPEAGGVLLTWFEVPGADHYQIFESTTQTLPTTPIQSVPANQGGSSNSYLRTGLNDNLTRFYAVKAITFTGVVGTPSVFVQVKGSTISTVAQSGTTATFTTSSTVFVPVPGFSTSITSASGNKVLIFIQANIGTSVAGLYVLSIWRVSSPTPTITGAVELFGPGVFSPTTTTNFYQPFTFIDALPPSGTNTYFIQAAATSGLTLTVFPNSILTCVNI